MLNGLGLMDGQAINIKKAHFTHMNEISVKLRNKLHTLN